MHDVEYNKSEFRYSTTAARSGVRALSVGCSSADRSDEFKDERTDGREERNDRRAGGGVQGLLKPCGGCAWGQVMNAIFEVHFDHAL